MIEIPSSGWFSKGKGALQILWYAWLYKKNHPSSTLKVMPALMNSRGIFEKNFDARLLLKHPTEDDITPHEATFLEALSKVLQELFDPTVPFTQTADTSRCATCPYKGICQR